MNPGDIIRKMGDGDLARICTAFFFQDPEQWKQYDEANLRGERVTLLALRDDLVMGYANLIWQSEYTPFQAAGIPEINNMHVLDPYLRQGVGTALIHAAEQIAAQAGKTVVGIGVVVSEQYAPAQRLYPKLGYLPDGRGLHPSPYGDVLYLTRTIAMMESGDSQDNLSQEKTRAKPMEEPMEDKFEAGESQEAEPVEQIEGLAGKVSGENVAFSDGLALSISANQSVTISDAAALVVGAGNDVSMSDGGAIIVGAGRDVRLTDGGALSLSAGGNADITNGGALLVVSNAVTMRGGSIGVNISGQTNLGEGSQITMDTQQALAFGAAFGAAFGLVFALLSRLLRRR